MTRPGWQHWSVVLAVAAAVHVGLFVRLATAPPEPQAVDEGAKAITVALAPKPAPEPIENPEPEPEPTPVPEPQPEPEPSSAPPPSSSPPPENSTPAEQEAPETTAGATGGVADATPDYRTKLQAWLERHKEYPRRARRLGIQGRVLLYFVIDREGNVLEWKIREKSGQRLLDEAVADMIRRADPMPAMPAEMEIARLQLVVPVNFQLR